MRYFNTSGPNIPSEHYTLPRKELIGNGLDLVHKNRYFTIWAPRQTGKSTYFRLLAEELVKEGYKVCHVNVEHLAQSDESFLCHYLSKEMSKKVGRTITGDSLKWVFDDYLHTEKDEKYVLIIDEIESLNPTIFNLFLHTIRQAYHNRSEHALKSVMLVGVSNITGVIQDNASPFNIADNLDIPYFTKTEIFELLGQHESETGQLFDTKVKAQIDHITAGQPGLVNGFALRMVEKNPIKKMLEYADYLAVEDWYLYQALDKNVANIVNKAKNHQKFVEELLFTETRRPFSIYDERTHFLYTNGLIKRNEEGNIEFWVPLYKKCLQQYFYPRLNGEAEEIQRNLDIDEYFGEKGELNMDKVMQGYKEYAARRGFRYFIEKEADGTPKGLLEAGLMYSFETYIQSFLQVMKGKSYLEPHVALGRSDLIINIRGQEFVIEGKIYYNITQFIDGKAQLAYYMQSLGLTKGIYLVFADSKVTHPKVIETVDTIGNVQVTTYIVRYDLATDFSEPRKTKKK